MTLVGARDKDRRYVLPSLYFQHPARCLEHHKSLIKLLVQLKSEQFNQRQNPQKQQNPRLPKDVLVSNKETECFLKCVEPSVGLGKGKCGALQCMRPAGVLDPSALQQSPMTSPLGLSLFAFRQKS